MCHFAENKMLPVINDFIDRIFHFPTSVILLLFVFCRGGHIFVLDEIAVTKWYCFEVEIMSENI